MTREKVFQAAKKLFAEKGYNETRSGDIAKCAGVSHGTVFSHFKTKSAILERMQEEFLALEINRIGELKTENLSCEKSLKLMASMLWKGAMRNLGVNRAIFARSWLWSKDREHVYQQLTGRIREFGALQIRKGQANGEIGDHLDEGLAMEIFDAVYCGCLRKSVIDPDRSDDYLQQLERTIELICLQGRAE